MWPFVGALALFVLLLVLLIGERAFDRGRRRSTSGAAAKAAWLDGEGLVQAEADLGERDIDAEVVPHSLREDR